jgi:glycosyltransferase involved in cell wall biosynthesis
MYSSPVSRGDGATKSFCPVSVVGTFGLRGREEAGVGMTLTIGYDGKFLWRGAKFGARSGHGVHARHLLKEMLECWPQGRFNVYALDDDLGIDRRPNCQVVTLPGYAKNAYLRNSFAYPIELRRRPVDVLFAYTTLPAYAPCKTVISLADIGVLANPGWLPRHIALPRTLATRSSAKRADRIITETEFSRREIMRVLHVPPEKIVVVPQGVHSELAERLSEDRKSEVRAQYGIGPQYLLSLNDIHPRKNLEGLVNAFGRLKSRTGLPHQLVIAGRTLWPYPEFYRRVEASVFAHDIKVLGYVPSEVVPALYQGADLFVYPSFYEGWGLQVHESMMAGVPVIVSKDSAMSEIAGDAADTFDPYDVDDMSRSIERTLTDRVLRETLVARGFEQVKRFSWRKTAEATLAVCAGLKSA